MIKQRTNHYSFDPPLNMVHHFSPAVDNSALLIIQTQEGSDSIIHVDCNSNILMQYDFNDFVYTLAMPNETQAIVLEVESNCFKIFNLRSKTIITYAHKFSVDVSCQCYLDYFCDSKLLCVRQNGDHDDHKLRLSYYSYPFDLSLPSKDNLKLEYISSKQDWTPLFNTRKINNHSQYVWYQSRQKNVFELRSFQIEDSQPKYQVITISMDSLCAPYNFAELNAAIIEVWQTRPREFCLVCATNKNQKNAVSPQTGVINNTFIWNLDTLTIRQSKFTFDPKFHDLLVDVHGTGCFSMFPTFYFQGGKPIVSPVYFVDNASESVFLTQEWTCSHRQKYVVSQRTKNQIMEGIFENGNVSELSMRTITFVMREQVSVFLLLNMNILESGGTSSWDDDLVNDVCRMLDYDQG